ncbi:MAG TPA: porin [Gammaproteobacteria bacterium]|nr:porin [Gammaproteobacteria bacterium]
MRSLTALALAAALAAPAIVSAQEIKVNKPEIYGRLHLSLNQMDNGDEDALNLSSNSSRIGFRGSMDISEGLQAFYQMEAGYNADHGGGQLASRNTFAGLRGVFGEIQAGQFDTPVKNIGSKVDLFSDQVGDNGNIIRYGVRGDLNGYSFDEREKNMIQYTTPGFSGLQAQLAYSTNVNSTKSADGELDQFSYMAALTYTGVKGLYVGLGYQVYGEDAIVAGGDEANIIRLGATYQLGALKLTGLFQQASDLLTGDDSSAYGVGAAYSLGKTVLKAQYYLLDHDADEKGADMISVGVDYKLAKNFTTYAAYSRIANDANQDLRPYADGISDALGTGTAGKDTQAFGVGVIYNF